jgi:hypothetical protein
MTKTSRTPKGMPENAAKLKALFAEHDGLLPKELPVVEHRQEILDAA